MEQRILIHAPTGQDGTLTAKVLETANISSAVCPSAADLAQQLTLGAGAVMTTEEALANGAGEVLGAHLKRQPGWSDLPVILLTRGGGDTEVARRAAATLGNVSLLERPVRTLTLITAAQASLRSRAQQYRVREAERRKDEFLASLGHELRNPLAPVKTSVALLSRLYPGTPEVLKICAVIGRQISHLTRLVDDLLDVARITSGKIALRPEALRLSAVIEHVKELCLQGAADKQLRISFDLPAEDIALRADPARLVQILVNILSNAIKFTPAGGQVALKAWRDGTQLLVSISDSGIGIDAATLTRIFSIFEQGKAASGEIASGLGIGLSLTRKFAEMHGGSVEAHSEGRGKGSQFLVRLPIIVAPAAGVLAAAPARSAKPGKVLVVDDNCDAADSLQALFQMEGYEASTAYDGASAVAAVQAEAPDLIVMDLGMPGMDGYEAGRLIRQLPQGRDILIIALTGWGQGDARRQTRDAGFDFHLIKPVDFNDIIGLLNSRLPAGHISAGPA
ncbi:signal transduction histidine kinase/ActR/RegA family two-component response regulator [Oxalobacteraceae bacterium GrIS 1.11]